MQRGGDGFAAAGGAHSRRQLRRAGGTRQWQIGQVPVLDQRRDMGQQPGQILVAHRAKHGMRLGEIAHLVQVVGQRGHRLRVVRHIQHQHGLAGHRLEAPGQFDHRQPGAHRLGIDRQAIAQRLEHRQHAGRIEHLVGPAQRRVGQTVEALSAPAPGPLLLVAGKIEIAAQQAQISSQRHSAGLQRGRRLGVADHHRLAGAHDAGLLAGYRLAVVAQKLHVVQRNAGDQGAIGIHRVDGIEPPAHAHFQDHQVQRPL